VRPLEVDGRRLEAASRTAIGIPVTRYPNGGDIKLWVHALQGREDGPVLVLLSGLHGGEWFSIESIRTIVGSVDPTALRGTLLAIPVANPPALRECTRNIPDESDSPDLNRIFPGPLTWTSDQLIATISREVLSKATHMIDFHMGPWGSAFQDTLAALDFPDPAVVAQSAELARAFGSPIIRRANVLTGFPGPKSSIGYCGGVLGIPAIAVELGGAGFGEPLERQWRDATVEGVRRVMVSLGMLADDRPEPPRSRTLEYRVSHRVNPTVAGVLRPNFGGADLGAAVTKGERLGTVLDSYTHELLEELTAPADGLLFYVARDYAIQPGEWAFGVADTDHASSRWI
jgi:hypothetical protein